MARPDMTTDNPVGEDEDLPMIRDASRDKVFHFLPRPEPSAEVPQPGERRDWAAAIDLIKEASEAVRFAEERAQNAEDYSKQLAAYQKEQMKGAEARVAAAERKAEAALARAADAEAWLARFHDAIIEGFGRPTKEE